MSNAAELAERRYQDRKVCELMREAARALEVACMSSVLADLPTGGPLSLAEVLDADARHLRTLAREVEAWLDDR